MKTYIGKHLPVGIWLIAAFYIFGALVLVIALFTNNSNVREVIAAAHGLSPNIGAEFVVAVAVLALVLAYGLVSLSRWGFFLAISYSLFLCVISLMSGGLSFAWTGQRALQIQFGNLLWSIAVLAYLLLVHRRFLSPETRERPS